MTVPIMIPNAVHICLSRPTQPTTSTHSKFGRNVPHHDQSATDRRRSTLRGIDGDRGGLRADTEAKNEARDEQVPPRVGETLPETSNEGDERGDKDGSPASEVLVQRRREPTADKTAAELKQSTRRVKNNCVQCTEGKRRDVRTGRRSRVRATTGCWSRSGGCQSGLGRTSSRR